MRPRSWFLATTSALAMACSGTLTTEGVDRCEDDTECDEGSVCRSGSCFAIATEPCEDLDSDGFFRGPGCSPDADIDCDDNNAAINPSEAEVCGDGVDQNCFGGADEACDCTVDGIGTTRDCGTGRCAGIQTCAESGWSECIPLVSPLPEQCGDDGRGDGSDDDCNGEVDDGCGVLACPGRPDGTGDEIVCPDEATCSSNGICL